MKSLALAVSIIALGAAGASAADLAARPYTKAPPLVVAVYDWSGFYVGLNGGGGSSHKCWDLNTAAGAFVSNAGCHNATGGMVGGQIGYRWQMTSWVFGLQAQGDWANLTGSNLSLVAAGLTNQTKINALGLFTGQVGYAWNNFLWYIDGGAAVANDKYYGIGAAGAFDQASETRWGGAIGTGVEYGFAPGWSVAVEYDHAFMASHNLSFTSTGLTPGGILTPAGAFSRNVTVHQDVDMATARISYHFGNLAVAKY